MITKEEVLMGRVKYEDLTPELQANLDKLVDALNVVRTAYNQIMRVSSGYRSPAKNAAIGGSKKSYHMQCLACDFKDSDGKLDEWLLENQDLLEENGLWQENPGDTTGWAHLDLGTRDTTKKREHKRVFKPYPSRRSGQAYILTCRTCCRHFQDDIGIYSCRLQRYKI